MKAGIYQDFELYFPGLAKMVVDRWRGGPNEIIVLLSDDTKFIYNAVTKTIRKYRTFDDCSDEEWRIEFSQRLDNSIVAKGITQNELAEAVGVSPMTISRYINGRAWPDAYLVVKISKVLECSIESLIDF